VDDAPSYGKLSDDLAGPGEPMRYYETVCPACDAICKCGSTGQHADDNPFFFEMQPDGRVLVTLFGGAVIHLCPRPGGGGDGVPAIRPDSPPPRVLAAERTPDESN
jgi:hypothetical protein